MRTVLSAADPDSIPRRITLPADWDDEAADALAALLPGEGAGSLPAAADNWIGRLHGRSGAEPGLGRALALLLLQRRAAPGPTSWRGSDAPVPCFVLNLAGFVKPGSGFETDSYESALRALAHSLRLDAGAGGLAPKLMLTNLDACLAALGLDYDSESGRDVARCLVGACSALLRGDADALQMSLVRPPKQCAVPGLAALAGTAGELPPPGRRIETGFSVPNPVDALLGVEACGFAPIFSPLRADGRLGQSTLARLAGRGLTPEAALALSLAGDGVLPRPGRDAWLAMHRALSGLTDHMPPLPEHQPTLVRPDVGRRELPARRRGFTQKAAVAGHRLFLQTGEFEDGSLGELSITPPRENPAMRGMMDAFGRAVSLGLQHGVPLEAYVDAFAYSRFGPAGSVDGDGGIAHATSLLDYAFRMLSEAYLGRTLPDAPADAPAQHDERPLLPLDLPETALRPRPNHRSALRVVGGPE